MKPSSNSDNNSLDSSADDVAIELSIPDEFLCPITHEIMRNPLLTRHGQTFEREAILNWLANHDGRCPLTRKQLSVSDLIRHRALEAKIEAWCYVHGNRDVVVEATPSVILLTCLKSDFTINNKNRSNDNSNIRQGVRRGILRRIVQVGRH
jgi:U-box domain